jgi:hypothetical protein
MEILLRMVVAGLFGFKRGCWLIWVGVAVRG